jgi:hypothetical protein
LWYQDDIIIVVQHQSSLPFPLTAGHYDSGMEFINRPLLEWCLAKHIKAARSKPCRKNDNCFAEQKNYEAVRKTAGYFWFDTPAEQEALAEVYTYLCPLYNYRYPAFKPVDKVKQGDGRYRKVYEKTPVALCRHLPESAEVSGECKVELTQRKRLQNPVSLNNGLSRAVEKLLKINGEKASMKRASGQEAEQAEAV